MRHPLRRTPRSTRGRLLRRLVVPLALAAATAASLTTVGWAAAPSSQAAGTGNPLAGRPWGVYQGSGDQVWGPYSSATGTRRALLAKIALQPKAKWFGAWVGTSQIKERVSAYIANASGGDPDTLVQMTDFRLKPWEHDACKRLPTAAERTSYERWTDNFAAGIGAAHVALVLQPDGPFALCAPGGSKVLSHLVRYAAQKLSALPNTSVYIDAGAADWLRDNAARAARILVPAGVAGVRGFALDGTHYDSTAREVRFGASIVKELAARGITGKHFVVNTSSNGRPFPGYHYPGTNFDNARVCRTKTDSYCVTLGIPPTADVADPQWGLRPADRALAARYADGYLWIGRPWLYMQADPFVLSRALGLARSTPY